MHPGRYFLSRAQTNPLDDCGVFTNQTVEASLRPPVIELLGLLDLPAEVAAARFAEVIRPARDDDIVEECLEDRRTPSSRTRYGR